MLERFCTRLAEEWEAEGNFASEVPGVWIIPLGEDLEVVLSEIEGGYTLMSALATLPEEEREEFFSVLMAANILGEGTRGGVLAIDEDDTVVLSQVVTYVSQQREFQESVEDFISTIMMWRQAIVAEAE